MSGIAGRVFRLLDDMKANLLARTGHLYIAHKEDGEALCFFEAEPDLRANLNKALLAIGPEVLNPSYRQPISFVEAGREGPLFHPCGHGGNADPFQVTSFAIPHNVVLRQQPISLHVGRSGLGGGAPKAVRQPDTFEIGGAVRHLYPVDHLRRANPADLPRRLKFELEASILPGSSEQARRAQPESRHWQLRMPPQKRQ